MTFRAAAKLVWFLFVVIISVADYVSSVPWVGRDKKRVARAEWLHRASRRSLKIYSCTTQFEGPVPTKGLLVSNHLSYLDILVFSAITPAVFVSKSEVREWPLFGWLASLGGTVFIQRTRRTDVGPVNREIESAMTEGALVVVFPEGTSTNGEEVLPFRSPLLEPAIAGTQPIAVACIQYELDGGEARNEVCYWGDHTFFPHSINLLGKKAVRVAVRFGTFQRITDDRKELAVQLREAVLKLQAKA